MRRINCLLGVLLCIFGAQQAFGFARPEKEYRIFQFPRTASPRIDGDFSDWDMVPDSYAIGLSELYDTHGGRGENLDPKEFDLTVKVGWVNGENRLYFYVEAYDDSWDFTDPGLRQDIFELVVDGDASGGPFIKEDNGNINKLPVAEFQGTWRPCAELPHFHAGAARERLGDGMGFYAVDQGFPVCQRRVRL